MTLVTLESLDLTADELTRCRECIRHMAFEKWLNAGQPAGDGLEFWTQAEREWIEHCYVPHRPFETDGAASD